MLVQSSISRFKFPFRKTGVIVPTGEAVDKGAEGVGVGAPVGFRVGDAVGDELGAADGTLDGDRVGAAVETKEGSGVGEIVGDVETPLGVGSADGESVNVGTSGVGEEVVGDSVTPRQTPQATLQGLTSSGTSRQKFGNCAMMASQSEECSKQFGTSQRPQLAGHRTPPSFFEVYGWRRCRIDVGTPFLSVVTKLNFV